MVNLEKILTGGVCRMRVEVQDLSEVEKLLKIEVPSETVNKIFQKVVNDFKKRAKIKGFREGKVPVYLVKKLFQEEIEESSKEKIIDETLAEAVKQSKLTPLLDPQLEDFGELKENESFVYSVRLEVRPEFELKKEDYIGIEVEKEKVKVNEEEVERILREIGYNLAELEIKEGEIEERNIAIINFVAYDEEGKEIPGHKADALVVDVGTGEFNKEIEKNLIGKKKGDVFQVEVKYEEEGLNPLLAGKKVVYHIEVKEVMERKSVELTDERIKELSLGFNTVEELRERIRNRLKAEKERTIQAMFRERLLEKILEKVDFPVPQRYVELKLNQLVEKFLEGLERDGYSPAKMNLSIEKLREKLKPVAEKQAKEELILEKIAELENIDIPEEEVEKEVETLAKGLKISKDRARSIVYFNILPKRLAEKTLQFLEENAKVIEKEPAEKTTEEEKTAEEKKATEEKGE